MTPFEVSEIRRSIAERTGPAPVLAEIIKATALAFGIEPAALLDHCRDKSIAEARVVAMYVARKCTRMSFPEIGRAFGGRHHTTVISAQHRARHYVTRDRWIAAAVAVLLEHFSEHSEAHAQ